jgi:hypothetical protein
VLLLEVGLKHVSALINSGRFQALQPFCCTRSVTSSLA